MGPVHTRPGPAARTRSGAGAQGRSPGRAPCSLPIRVGGKRGPGRNPRTAPCPTEPHSPARGHPRTPREGITRSRGLRPCTLRVAPDGVWRSLVARPLWERKAVGSNPATPTIRRPPGRRHRTRPARAGRPGRPARGPAPRHPAGPQAARTPAPRPSRAPRTARPPARKGCLVRPGTRRASHPAGPGHPGGPGTPLAQAAPRTARHPGQPGARCPGTAAATPAPAGLPALTAHGTRRAHSRFP